VTSAGRSRILSAIERVLARHKRMILTTTLAAAVLAAIVSFIISKTYTATARLLPPKVEIQRPRRRPVRLARAARGPGRRLHRLFRRCQRCVSVV